ncbi:hypothetical protein [Nocardioides marmorisolisilvae]|uniref:Uncharacterized protein n=1 Tax=Nocardioides marmorisolisilvae TaxID=1542737 RepID=A0A3N0DUP3_9ACTN|nr:hypothetical protein [Nocardioides marmorisolisilvae]RNL79345.1 hypothetical protein EFL95_10145 [Nocardioides marmorisolisilvae]
MTSRSTLRAVLAAVASLTLLAGTASAAHADAFRHRDPTGDVLISTADENGPHYSHDSRRRLPDIQQFTVLHTRWTVSVATALRGLDAIDDAWSATVVTSKGDRFQVGRNVSTGSLDGFTPFVTASRNGYHFKCDGITATRTRSGVIAKIPTRCLGNPWKVRVGVQASSTYAECCPEVTGLDDALLNGAYTDRKPALSPWIAR